MIFLFDLDGTLIDSTAAILASMKRALESENLSASEEFIKSQIGASLSDMMKAFGCTSKEQMMRLLERYKEHYGRIYIEQTSLLPGALEAVKLASEHGQAAVVTTKTGFYARKLCEHLGLAPHLSALVGGDEVCAQTKPAPAPIYAALSDIASGFNSAEINELTQARANCQTPWWQTPPDAKICSQAVMIGDTLNDTLAASAAGIRAYVTLFEYTDASKFSSVSVLSSPLECVQLAIKENK